MEKILIIAGCTAVGKSAFALSLAKHLNMEIISADSIQIYKGVNIATSKPTKEEKEQCKHHLIDFVAPFDNDFNVYKYVILAKQCITDILSRGKLPVVVGGTGLYIDSLLYGFDFASQRQIKEKTYQYEARCIFLETNRDVIYSKINRRVDKWVDDGLLDEIKALRSMGVDETNQCMQAIGYKEMLHFLSSDDMTLEQTIDLIKKNTRNYAKRQITWFNHNNFEHWDLSKQDKLIAELLTQYVDFKK